MPDKDPANWSVATWALALLMPLGGGFINWYARVKTGHTRAFNILELLGEIFTSGFVGLWVFMFLAYQKQDADTMDLVKAAKFEERFTAEFGPPSAAIDEHWAAEQYYDVGAN